jgi:hypothetical protein
MRKSVILTAILFFLVVESFAQSMALGLDNVNGTPFTCSLLDDLGTYKRLRVQANQSTSNGRWEFPVNCSYPGDIWRPYIEAEATAIPFNVVIPPTPSTYGALWNSNNGGAPGRLSPVTSGYYYTFNVENITCSNGTCNSPHIGVLETSYEPVNFPTVTQNPLADAVGDNVPVTITVTSTSTPTENVFVRYTTNEYVNTTIVPVTFSGTTGTAVIPGFPVGTTVKYYVYSSPKSQSLIESEVAQYGEIVHDMSTLNWNINIGSNYPYMVINTAPVKIQYLRGTKQNAYNNITWKVDCINTSGAVLTLERSTDGRNFTPVYSINTDAAQCAQPFGYRDENFMASSINYYRLKMQDNESAVSYSQVIAIINKESGFVLLGVSPTILHNELLSLNVSSSKSMKIIVSLTDATGRSLQKTNFSLESGSNQCRLDVSKLSPGTYNLSIVSSEGEIKSARFVKL